MRSFTKIEPSRNGENSLSFTDIGKSRQSCKFFTWQICLLKLFAKINSRENSRIYSIEAICIRTELQINEPRREKTCLRGFRAVIPEPACSASETN